MSDTFQRFIFEKLDIRGAFVQLETSWQAMQTGRDYAPATLELLGQTTAITTLIGSQLKTPGRLTFQIQGQGAISMLVVDCDEQLRLRGMAKTEPNIQPGPVSELIGDGRLMLTVQTNDNPHPYQSFVPLQGDSIAAIFEHYLEQSEQQPTRLWLFADGERACGLFLQMLPESKQNHEQDEDGWNRIQQLAATIRPDEFALPPEELLHRLFAEEDVRLFEAHPVTYHCPRNEEKVRGALQALGKEEVESILEEHGEIRVHDDICNHEYIFGEEIIEELFPAGKRLLH
ncbi:MAG TPA: Hsp33 family molecular chaperone HslO [Rhodocyclaceae bacterium]|nr:Hsp33 family molecular chaperone HslO [Rhodocyclaceae bacterium]